MRRDTATVKITSPGLISPLLHKWRDQINMPPAISHSAKSCSTRIRSIYITLLRCAVASVFSSCANRRRSRECAEKALTAQMLETTSTRAPPTSAARSAGSMARCTVLTENRKGACGHQHEETKSHHKTP